MGRPRKDSGEVPVQHRIEDAFWELLATNPLDKITVAQVAARARCNRGTFYVYYASMDDLISQQIDDNLAREFADAVFAHRPWVYDVDKVKAAAALVGTKIDRLCLLLNASPSGLAREQVTQNLKNHLLTATGLDENDHTVRIVVEFWVNGVIGVLAARAASNMSITFDEIMDIIAPEIPMAALAVIQRANPSFKR